MIERRDRTSGPDLRRVRRRAEVRKTSAPSGVNVTRLRLRNRVLPTSGFHDTTTYITNIKRVLNMEAVGIWKKLDDPLNVLYIQNHSLVKVLSK